MNHNDTFVTSYKAAHTFLPIETLDSNVTGLNSRKEFMPNNPKLKHWNYETTTNISYDFKFNIMDPGQNAARVHCSDQIQYLMPHWEKYWSNFPKPTRTSQTEYKKTFMQPKFMSNVNQTSISCFQPKQLDVHKEIPSTSIPKISYRDVIGKRKLCIIEEQINSKQQKQNKMMPEYRSFYNEPIFNSKNTIYLLPNTFKHVSHNGLRTLMSDSYKIPNNTLSQYESIAEMPTSISKNPTSSRILPVPGMYTTEYSKIGAHKKYNTYSRS